MHFAARDSYSGSVNLLGTTPYLSRKPIQVSGRHPALEPICVALVVESMLVETTGQRSQGVLAHYRNTIPQSVILGEYLFDRQTLQRLKADQATAAEMVKRVLLEMA